MYNFKQHLQTKCKIGHTLDEWMWLIDWMICVFFFRLQRKFLWSTFPARTWRFMMCRSAGPWLLAPCSLVSVVVLALALQSSVILLAVSVSSAVTFHLPLAVCLPFLARIVSIGHMTHVVYKKTQHFRFIILSIMTWTIWDIITSLIDKMVTKPMQPFPWLIYAEYCRAHNAVFWWTSH